jgi:hypothetical protein
MKSLKRNIAGLTFTSLAILALGTPALGEVAATHDFDQTFLTDYSKLEAKPTDKGVDYHYVAPGVFDRLAGYKGVMVDQPEVLISPDSPYKGDKPDNLKAIAEMMREALNERLIMGGYDVTEQPGPGIVYLRLALTDLELKKKKRGLLSYTPIGAAVKFGTDALKEMMDKVDITHMAVQVEIVDSQSGEVLAAEVAVRDRAKMRMEFGELESILASWGARIRCRLDNARVGPDQQIDCLDREAVEAQDSAAAAR